MDEFERKVRQRLKELGPENKVFLKERYEHELFSKHGLEDQEINCLFDMKKLMRVYPDDAFPETRIIGEINLSKKKKFEVIFMFDPILKGKVLKGKVGIVTAY